MNHFVFGWTKMLKHTTNNDMKIRANKKIQRMWYNRPADLGR